MVCKHFFSEEKTCTKKDRKHLGNVEAAASTIKKRKTFLGQAPPDCEELGCEGYDTKCCSCGEYCCTTKKEEHFRQSLIEAADELEAYCQEDCGQCTTCKFAKKLRISAGESWTTIPASVSDKEFHNIVMRDKYDR